MAPNTNASRKPGAASSRNARNTSVKKRNSFAVDDLDPTMQPSQSSSDDGMMATIAQQMQATMEKKKKEKESKFLQMAQTEISKILTGKAHDFADGVAEIDNIFTDFRTEYAINEDNIRKLWNAILEEQLHLQAFMEEKQRATLEREKRREKEHIQALAHCRKACEESQRLINSLSPSYDHT